MPSLCRSSHDSRTICEMCKEAPVSPGRRWFQPGTAQPVDAVDAVSDRVCVAVIDRTPAGPYAKPRSPGLIVCMELACLVDQPSGIKGRPSWTRQVGCPAELNLTPESRLIKKKPRLDQQERPEDARQDQHYPFRQPPAWSECGQT